MTTLLSNLWRRHCPDVIVERLIDGTHFHLSLRDHLLWARSGAAAVRAEQIPWPRDSMVWDLGCNIGVFSVQAALLGNRVVAFDISETNIACLRSTSLNGANSPNLARIQPHLGPVTVARMTWSPARTGHAEEKLVPSLGRPSLTYLEAAERFGIPSFIKMDIQGAEKEFLCSREWRAWLDTNHITWFVEIHPEAEKHVWGVLQQLDATHFLYTPRA